MPDEEEARRTLITMDTSPAATYDLREIATRLAAEARSLKELNEQISLGTTPAATVMVAKRQ